MDHKRHPSQHHSCDSDVLPPDNCSDDDSKLSESTVSTLSTLSESTRIGGRQECGLCGVRFRMGRKKFQCGKCGGSVCREHSRKAEGDENQRVCDKCARRPLEDLVRQELGDPRRLKEDQLKQLIDEGKTIEQNIAAKEIDIAEIRERMKTENSKWEARLDELMKKVEEESRMLMEKTALVNNLKISAQSTQSAESTQAERLQSANKQLEEVKDLIAKYHSDTQHCEEMIDHFTLKQSSRVHVTQISKLLCEDCKARRAGQGKDMARQGEEEPQIHQIIDKVVAAVPDLATISQQAVETALSDEVFPNPKMKKVVVESIVEEVRENPSDVAKDPDMLTALTPQLRLTNELTRLKSLLPSEEQTKFEWCVDQMTAPKTSSPVRSYINYILKTFGSETATLLSDYSGDVREALFQQDDSTSRETIRRRSLQRTQSLIHLSLIAEMPALSIEGVSSLNFDIFEVGEARGYTGTLLSVSSLVFENLGLLTDLEIPNDTFNEFVKQIGKGYLRNPYHNALHAADVLQTTFVFYNLCNLEETADFDSIDKGALFISSIIHDYKHPGYNNAFLEKTSNKIALRYNDVSCLENYHLGQAFKLAASPQCNIFKDMPAEVRRSLRKYIIQCVLGTDMAKHSMHASEASSKLGNPIDFPAMKPIILGLIIHAADISNPTKPYAVYEKWAVRVSEEFYLQGDKEKELDLPLTFQYDRATANLANMQIGFIKGVVLPYFTPLARAWPGMDVTVRNLTENAEIWAKRVEEFAKH